MDTESNSIVSLILTGGLLGILGQGIRIVVGVKKFKEENALKAAADQKPMDSAAIFYSIFIGFVAGGLGLLLNKPTDGVITNQLVLMIMATGYSGADFIEGVFGKYLQNKTAAAPTNTAAGNNSLLNAAEEAEG